MRTRHPEQGLRPRITGDPLVTLPHDIRFVDELPRSTLEVAKAELRN